ncbi:MAG: 4-hydroxy-tetrahydrodipicolinate reductase, partial [Microbacteriaceae bacterium]|nr:4-hydroxy-tetrahydrodipicolinate reductase [Microbacteriaceae bacterium]
MTFTVAVVGASGRLGGVITSVVEAMPEAELVARIGSKDALDGAFAADVVIEATAPAVSP